MKVIATIQTDLEVTPLGTRSRLANELCGVPVLRRTVDRVRLAKRIEEVYVLCPTVQYERCTAMLDGTGTIVRRHDAGVSPWSSLVQTARKWSLDGWRGGIGGTTCFDEYTDGRLIGGLLRTVGADAVLSIPPASPLFDPILADRMIEHHCETDDDVRVTFTQAPPGLTGILLDATLVHELTEKGIPVGLLFSYKPDSPLKDPIFQPCCCEIPAELRHAVGRLIADTDRSMERLAALLREHEAPDAAVIGLWLSNREEATIEPVPHEVEIELTTNDPYPDALLRPRGSRVEARGPIDPSIVEQVVAEITQYDDALLVLGGFGDPLRHPNLPTILESIRSVQHDGRSLFGLAIRTAAADLNDILIDTLVMYEVDVLNVVLDAWTPELYGRLQSPSDPAAADLDAVLKRLDRLSEVRQRHQSVKPIVVPEMAKTRENVHELDDFHDGWLRRLGAVLVSGHSHYAGQCEDRSVICMAPSPRVACRRIRSRCLILADGRVMMCDQDFNGRHALGRIGEQSLEEIWNGEAFTRVRETHRRGRFNPTPLCTACEDWHRP